MPIIKTKILRNVGDEISIINREQLETELLEVIGESLEETEKQYELDNKINVVDRGFLLQEKNIFYCALELDPGEIYAPPAAGVIILAWKKGLVKSSEIDIRLKPYKKYFKRK